MNHRILLPIWLVNNSLAVWLRNLRRLVGTKMKARSCIFESYVRRHASRRHSFLRPMTVIEKRNEISISDLCNIYGVTTGSMLLWGWQKLEGLTMVAADRGVRGSNQRLKRSRREARKAICNVEALVSMSSLALNIYMRRTFVEYLYNRNGKRLINALI